MPKKTDQEEMAPKSCRDCGRWQEIKNKIRISELLTQAIDGFGERVRAKDIKLTLADYVKLLQIEKEMEEETPKEIKVTWVDPAIPSETAK